MQKRDKIVLGIGLFAMVLTIIIGTSFAYWKLSKVQEDQNIIATGCFNVEFSGGDGINLQSAYPISDEEGLKLTPYTFTIENKCDSYVSYQINLETLSQTSGVKVLPDEYVRVDLQEGTSSKVNSTLNSSIVTEKTLTEATKAYKLYTRYLKPNETKTYNLRIWMDKDTPAIEEVMNAFYSGKIAIDFSYIAKNPMENAGTLIATTGSDGNAFYYYRGGITKIVFQNELKPIETELSWDVSDANDGSVMSYLVPNEDDSTKFTLYLQGDGGIYANPDSSNSFYYFYNLTAIEGLEYFDTSKVTNMSSMFESCNMLTNLDLSNFDTSKVTNMSSMFESCNMLTNLDLSNFDTSKVTDMSDMFNECERLTSLDLSNFDTSNVTDMKRMFKYCESLTEIDLSNFNTSNVTNMGGMFCYSPNLKRLDLSNFNTSNVTDMEGMFGDCINLEYLDISSFNFQNVKIIGYKSDTTVSLFENCKKINTVININSITITAYQEAFSNAATEDGSQIIVNYTEAASSLVDNIIATKSEDSNIIKGNVIPVYSISLSGSGGIDYTTANAGMQIEVKANAYLKTVKSFKLNGTTMKGNKFIMPNNDVTISDVEFVDVANISSDHDTSVLNDRIYYENTFEDAKSITITINYGTPDIKKDYINIYDDSNSVTPVKVYGGSGTTETIVIKGNYIKITYTRTSGVVSYGFNATITPNY